MKKRSSSKKKVIQKKSASVKRQASSTPLPLSDEALMGTSKKKQNSSSSNNSSKVSTGIPGFDSLVEGGFEQGAVILVRGGSGAAKTIFTLQFLYNGITQFGEPGVFISFEESKQSIFETGEKFGWDFAELEKQGKFAFIRYSPHEIEAMIKEGGGTIRDLVDSIKAKRVVLDSLSAYSAFFSSEYTMTEGVLSLIDVLKSWQCTCLVTDEAGVSLTDEDKNHLSFLTDGLIHLYHLRKDFGKYRALEIIKMRHIRHAENVRMFTLENDGIHVQKETSLFGK